jgi:hypothetical protein
MKEASRLPGKPDHGSPASKSPKLQNPPSTQQESGGRWEEIKGALSSKREIGNVIENLVRAGANADSVLDALALAVCLKESPNLHDSWLREMRRTNRNLKSLAAQIQKTALAIKKIHHTPASHSGGWESALRKVPDEPVISVVDRAPEELLSQMRAYANGLEAKAETLGRWSKARAAYYKREPSELFMSHLRRTMGNIRPHLPALAEILAIAYETFGIDASRLTAEGLAKILKRYRPPTLNHFLRRQNLYAK